MMEFKKVFDVHIPRNAVPTTTAVGVSGMNALGYRCADFAERGSVNLLSIGCSWCEGPAEAGTRSFSSYVCEEMGRLLGVTIGNWNMGIGGNSADYMARTLMCSLDVLKPDAVFLIFPGHDRQEYLRADGKLIRYQIDYIDEERHNLRHWKLLDPIDKEMIRHFNGLASPFEDAMTLLKSYKLMELMLNGRNVPWGFSMVPLPELEEIVDYFLGAGWMDRSHYLGHAWKPIDLEPDDHPGPKSRLVFGNEVFKWFTSKYMGELKAAVARGGDAT
jgi:hypothetical protein